MATDFDLLDTELPPPVTCETGFQRPDGTFVPDSEMPGGGSGPGGGGYIEGTWTETARTTEDYIVSDVENTFSVIISKVTSIDFTQDQEGTLRTFRLELTGL